MRKKIISINQEEIITSDQNFLDIEEIAEIELTSEDVGYPIESALLSKQGLGWRASTTGKQFIRLLFNEPQRLQRILLKFEETNIQRTQEYVLRYSLNGDSFHEIVRQQWNFSPNGSTVQTEDHHVDLQAITTLELMIIPDINGSRAFASLAQLKLE